MSTEGGTDLWDQWSRLSRWYGNSVAEEATEFSYALGRIFTGQRRAGDLRTAGIGYVMVGLNAMAGAGVADDVIRGGRVAADEAYHYTFSRFVSSIERQDLRGGTYATPNGALSPLQAHIDLALRPNRGLPDTILRIDLEGLRRAGYQIPDVTQVGRSFGMPGGGYEVQSPVFDPA